MCAYLILANNDFEYPWTVQILFNMVDEISENLVVDKL